MIKSITVGSFSALLSFVMLFGDSYPKEAPTKEIKLAEVKTVEEICKEMPLNQRIIELETALNIEDEDNDN